MNELDIWLRNRIEWRTNLEMGNFQKYYCNKKEEEKEAEELGIAMNYRIYSTNKQCIFWC
jgi:hypothetical protein